MKYFLNINEYKFYLHSTAVNGILEITDKSQIESILTKGYMVPMEYRKGCKKIWFGVSNGEKITYYLAKREN